MSRIIISSSDRDAHADAVLWGLRTNGHSARLWQPHAFPAEQALSLELEPDQPGRHFIDSGGESIELGDVTTVWNRRAFPPRLGDGVDPRDRDFARRESEQHLEGFLATACRKALWVNPPAAARLDTDKARQLELAREVGFAVPATLMSNAPDRIRRFFDRHGGDIVYKSYRSERWLEGGERPLVNHTAAVSAEDMSDDAALAMCPGIFQQRIPKVHELRVTVMGSSLFGVRIDASGSEAGRLDWRSDRAGMQLAAVPLSDELTARCRTFMARAGLVFACFDFIVSPTSELWFLEVNPMGQFLWQEERIPDLPLLDAMCAFLASGDPDFTWQRPRTPLTFADYRQSKRGAAARAEPADAAA